MLGQARSGAQGVLAVDVGNTETSFGVFENGELVGRRSLSTRQRLTPDEALISMRSVLSMIAPAAAMGGAILSCVVPPLTETWLQALRELSATRPLVVGPGLKTGVRMRYRDPSEVGPDRMADLVAARERYGAPVVVVDMGTTLNIEVVDSEGTFQGGLIAPGFRLGARALSQAAARLPMIELRAPQTVIGRSTREAMQSGVVYGEVARVDGLLDMVANELGEQPPVVVTGDGAGVIATLLRHDSTVDDDLTLRGLYLLWRANQR